MTHRVAEDENKLNNLCLVSIFGIVDVSAKCKL